MDTNMEEIEELIEFIPYSIGIELPDVITIILIITGLFLTRNKDRILSYIRDIRRK